MILRQDLVILGKKKITTDTLTSAPEYWDTGVHYQHLLCFPFGSYSPRCSGDHFSVLLRKNKQMQVLYNGQVKIPELHSDIEYSMYLQV